MDRLEGVIDDAMPPRWQVSRLFALWLSWGVFVVSLSAGAWAVGWYGGRALFDAVPALGAAALLLAWGIYRLLCVHAEPTRAGAPTSWPTRVFVGLTTLVGLAPAIVFPPHQPGSLIYAPWGPLGFAHVYGVAPFALLLVLWALWRFGVRGGVVLPGERRLWWRASAVVFGVHAAWASTLLMHLVFLLHLPALEGMRREVEGTGTSSAPARVGVFRFDRAGELHTRCGGGPYVVGEWRSSPFDGGFVTFDSGGGAGFVHAPDGDPFACFNLGSQGPLPGGGRWYVDD